MKLRRVTDLLTGAIIAVLIIFTGIPSFASSFQEAINVTFDDIKIFVDGNQINARDANGTAVEPFIYNGTTYLPVRAVGEAFGKNVSWDGSTKSVYIGLQPEKTGEYMSDIMKPYQSDFSTTAINTKRSMGGEDYLKNYLFALVSQSDATASFNLDGKYSTIKGVIGLLDYHNQDQIINVVFKGDDRELATFDLSDRDLPKQMDIDVSGVLKLDIIATAGTSDVNKGICMANPIIY